MRVDPRYACCDGPCVMDETDMERRSVGELLDVVMRRAGRDLLDRMGGLEPLSRADPLEIAAHLETSVRERGDRVYRRRVTIQAARAVAAAFELGRRAEAVRATTPRKLGAPADVAAWAMPRLSTLTHEELWMLGVDGRGHLRAARCIARGGLHGAAVRAADPLRAALRVDASAFVLVHNHPSGDPTPSREDVLLTARVAAAAEVVGLVLLDHVIVARAGFACVPFTSSDGEARNDKGLAM